MGEDEEAAAGTDMAEPDPLPLALQLQLVGIAQLYMVGQRLAAGRLGGLGRRQTGDVEVPRAQLGLGPQVDVVIQSESGRRRNCRFPVLARKSQLLRFARRILHY